MSDAQREKFENKFGKRPTNNDPHYPEAGFRWDSHWEGWQAGAAAENEACAKAICSGCDKGYRYRDGSHERPHPYDGWFECPAEAIRARRKQGSRE